MRRISSLSRNDFKNNSDNIENWYDLFDDWKLIESSLTKQYGIRIRKDISTMEWAELSSLISGLMADTPLGNIVRIRSEDDKESLKRFSKDELQIRSDWRNKKAKSVSEKELKQALEQMKQAFIAMAKGGAKK